MSFEGTGKTEGEPSTGYTSVTKLGDLNRSHFLACTYDAFNSSMFDLDRLSSADRVHVMPVGKLDPIGGDATEALLTA